MPDLQLPERGVVPRDARRRRADLSMTLPLLRADGHAFDDEAAEKMNLRRKPARTRLRSILCKTGVTRQTMLVRLLLKRVISLG